MSRYSRYLTERRKQLLMQDRSDILDVAVKEYDKLYKETLPWAYLMCENDCMKDGVIELSVTVKLPDGYDKSEMWNYIGDRLKKDKIMCELFSDDKLVCRIPMN